MTEEQRMEEGRRMFQIFAARMFEQRVLTAYREKVARERQRKLIEELEEETRLDTQREAKRAKEAAKKKEKKKMQKQAKDEEKAKREAEKAAQEAAARAVEEKKLEEQRQRKEEQRKKRDAEKKAAEEERLKKEADKQKRVQEERERQQELERKQKEAKEREKKSREDARKKGREEKDAKEQEARDRKAKADQERKVLEGQGKKDKGAIATAEKEARDRARQEEQGRQNAKRPPIAVPPGIHPAHPSALQSPQFQVATPIIPAKAPTSARPGQSSQQRPQSHGSHGSSPQSQQAATTENTLSSTPSSTSIALPSSSTSSNPSAKQQVQGPPLHHPQPSAPLSPLGVQTRSSQPPPGYNGMPGPSINGTAPSGLGVMPGMMPQMPMYQGPPIGGPHRGYGPPNGITFPPGMNGHRPFAQGPSGHFQPQSPMAPPAPIPSKQPPRSQPHSRQQSASYDRVTESSNQPNPISRPGPIGQSSASTPDKKENRNASDSEVEQLATQLGSKALLDDSDIPLSATSSDHVSAPGAPGSGRAPFISFPDSKHDAFQSGNWGAFSPNGAFAGPQSWGAPGLTPKQGAGWSTHPQPGANAFGIIGAGVHAPHRLHASQPVAIRLMVAEACRKLSATPGTSNDGFHPAQFLLRQIEQMKPLHEPAITLNEMLEICDTEGNAQNGGGSFIVRKDNFQGQSVKFEPSGGTGSKRPVGDIGSPMAAHSQLATFGGIGQPVSALGKGH
jgi:actin-related protein